MSETKGEQGEVQKESVPLALSTRPMITATAGSRCGDIYICGLAAEGTTVRFNINRSAVDSEMHISFPTKILFPSSPGSGGAPKFVSVCADMGLFAAVDSAGGLWGWGHGIGPSPAQLLDGGVVSCDVGAAFCAAITRSGEVVCFGSPFSHTFSPKPTVLPLPFSAPPVMLSACNEVLLVCAADGSAWCMGKGIASGLECHESTQLQQLQLPPTSFVAAGSVHSAAITKDGRLFVWGDGLSGTLGLGRHNHILPTEVGFFTESKLRVVHVACTRGQPTFKRVGNTKKLPAPGQEGPRCHVVTDDGRLWIAGTTHKGLGGNHLYKVMTPDADLTQFYSVGGAAADAKSTLICPTGAAEDLKEPALADIVAQRMGMKSASQFGENGKTNYLCAERILSSQPVHIHSIALSASGKLFTWGCGSDGRTGLRAFLRGPGGSKRRLKCYVSTPSVVEELEQSEVVYAAAGRYWTLAIVAGKK